MSFSEGGRDLAFPTQKPNADPALAADTRNRQRRTRIERFRRLSTQIKSPVFKLDFHYRAPHQRLETPVDDASGAREMTLFYAPLSGEAFASPSGTPPRRTVEELLDFVFLDCYGSVYPTDDPRHPGLMDYLKQELELVKAHLPDSVPIR